MNGINKFWIAVIVMMLVSVYPISAMGQPAGKHWAGGLLQKWSAKGLLPASLDSGNIPDKKLARGEFIALINMTFNFKEQRYDLFADVPGDAWYREDAAKAAAAGYLTGYQNKRGEYEVRAEQLLSRQEAAAILCRVFGFQAGAKQAVKSFTDWTSIGPYAVENIAYLTSQGYISGYPDHTFKPHNQVTLSEAVTMIDNIAGDIMNVKGEYEGTYRGNLVINTSDVSLKNAVVKGDLYITQGVGSGDIVLDHVNVQGNTYVNGGGPNSVVIHNSSLKGPMIIQKKEGDIRIALQGTSSLSAAKLRSGATLQLENGSAASVGEVTVEELMPGQNVTLDGHFNKVTLDAEGLTVTITEGSRIERLAVSDRSSGSSVHLAEGAIVAELAAHASGRISGKGKIEAATIHSANVRLDQKPEKLVVAPGLTVQVAGQPVSGDAGPPGTPAPSGGGFGGGGGVPGPSRAELDRQDVHTALAALTLGSTEIQGHIDLPSKGLNGTGITWSSSASEVIAPDGTVNRPAIGQEDRTVDLTATLVKGEATASKTFAVTVKALQEAAIVALALDGYQAALSAGTNHIHILLAKSANMNSLQLDFTIKGSRLMMGEQELKSGERYSFEAAQDIVLIADEKEARSYRLSILKVDKVVNTGLPALIINTVNGKPVLDKDNKIDASMTIVNGSVMQYGSGLYKGPVTIKGRGNSTWGMPKKGYAISLAQEAAMLDMPQEDDWVLLANYADKSLMRNYIALELGKSLGMAYTPAMRFVDYYLNGEYLGTYLFGEKIKISENRLSINKLKNSDNAGNEVTGGYLIEKDWMDRLDADDSYFTTNKVKGNDVFNIKEPKSSKITANQKAYISDYFTQAETALYGENFKDPINGYAKYYDTDSLIDWFIVNELFKNVDANFGTSVYLFKDRGGKIQFGPLWDFDLGAGNANYSGADYTHGFYVRYGNWISRFFQDPAFVQKLQDRWAAIKDEQIKEMFAKIRATESLLNSSAAENFTKWNILGHYVWPNANGPENRKTFASEVDYLESWLQQRVIWLQSNLSHL